ncbi:MAG TPA: tRNA 4-thiouridine(8) synthase ThiI [Clostridiales bacterium]|nr:tRNA 4-thiouridine(8) synthase ThiI [Clostridiales bacterium]
MEYSVNCIIIRPGELFLKGKNKFLFENCLFDNIKYALKDYDISVLKSQNRFYVENFNISDLNNILNILQKVFGITTISEAYKVPIDKDLIKETVLKIIPKKGKFRVTTKRAYKQFPMSSMEFSAYLGAEILKTYNELSVDLFDYDFNLNIDIRENKFAYIFFETIKGAGGLPVGISGKVGLLLSGGIDSPVAGYMIAKRGVELKAIHFYSFPYTSDLALLKVKDLAKKLSEYVKSIDLYIVPFTAIQEEIHKKCPEAYMITIMRRFMMRIAEKISQNNDLSAIVTGESLGQVASQTIPSIASTDNAINIPVLRPLIAFDKIEIIEIAKKINTYEISIRPYQDCCTVFVPEKPAIKPKLELVAKLEEELDIETLVNDAISSTTIETI